MSNISHVSDVNKPPRPAARGARWANRLAIVALLTLVLGPLAVMATRMEVAAWHAARGLDSAWDNQHEEAIAHYNLALQWDPESAGYLVLRAKSAMELGRTDEAIKDSAQARQLAPTSPVAESVYSTALLRAGRGKEAAAVYEDQLPYLGIYDNAKRASVENNAAAVLATVQVDLDRALKHIESALEYAPDQAYFIDTRAMVYYRLGEYSKALADMDVVLAGSDELAKRIDSLMNEASADDRHRAFQQREERRSLAQMLYHRALIHEALAAQTKDDEDKRRGHEIQAVADRQQIRDLGFTPEESLF